MTSIKSAKATFDGRMAKVGRDRRRDEVAKVLIFENRKKIEGRNTAQIGRASTAPVIIGRWGASAHNFLWSEHSDPDLGPGPIKLPNIAIADVRSSCSEGRLR
jgi:hypothetical protein